MIEDRKSKWSVLWILWLTSFLAIEIPAAFNDEEDDTLSEHVWMWIKGLLGIVSVIGLLISLFLHFIYHATVIPVIIFGAGLGVTIIRWYRKTAWRENMFRWDKWVQGLLAAGALSLVALAEPVFKDGRVTGEEWWMIGTTFVGAVLLYCKSHPPTFDDCNK